MALCRCLQGHQWPRGRTVEYLAYVYPVGYPETALVCGRCDNPGVIWLTDSEKEAYARQQRVFEGPNNFVRMKADDGGVHVK